MRTRPTVPAELARRFRRAGRRLGVDPKELGGVGLRIVDDREMARLNRSFRGERGPTDVLSFPGVGEHLGDIALDWPAVCRQAGRPGRAARLDEAALLLVHGLCHLLGHDHVDRRSARRMLRAERKALRGLGVPDRARSYGDGP